MRKRQFFEIHFLLSWGFWFCKNFSSAQAQADPCRILEFVPPLDGHALINHVIKNISLQKQDSCRVACYLDNDCLSYNFGRLQDGDLICQLSDSDHIQHPEDLKNSSGFIYRGTANVCANNLCSTHGKCKIDPKDNTYHCKCEDGFVGEHCEQAVYKRCSEAPSESGIYFFQLKDDLDYFPVYCDQASDGGGWTMVFRVVGNATPANVAELWNSDSTHSENVSASWLNTSSFHLGHYKNRIVLNENWQKFYPTESRVALYENGGEVRSLKFNNTFDMSNTDWFSQTNLISSPWADLKNQNPLKYFDIAGDAVAHRSFEISNKYGGCEVDDGWLVITGNFCPWENRRPLPSILYSKEDHLVKYDDNGAIGVADALAVFIR